ncbi:MAG: hypothetical protein MR033_01395 [Clostridiales bacterium]|nr:hypothetical protein [Clostridiales bacterium]
MKGNKHKRHGRRRAGAFCLAAALLCATLSACGGRHNAVTLDRMVGAGSTENLLTLHESFRIRETSYTERPSRLVYIDRELGYTESGTEQLLCLDGVPDYRAEGGVFYAYVYAGTEKTPAPNYAGAFYNPAFSQNETITGCRRAGDRLFVSTELPAEDAAKIFAADGYAAREGDCLTCIYTLEAKTLCPLEAFVSARSTDGTIVAYYKATVAYDVPRSANLEKLYEHAGQTADLRTITFVTAPDTEQEQAFRRQVPKGDSAIAIVPDGATLWLDRACTVEYTGEPDRVDDEEDGDAAPRQDDLTVYVQLP